MTPEQFVFWLQGYSEIRNHTPTPPTTEEWQVIQDHLKEVFDKVTPDRGGGGGGNAKVLSEKEKRAIFDSIRPGVSCSLPDFDYRDLRPRYCGTPGKIC